MRTVKLRQSGGAVIVSLPKAFLDQLGLGPDTPVDIALEEGKITIKKRHRIGLAARLAMCNFSRRLSKAEMAEERAWDAAPPKGREVI